MCGIVGYVGPKTAQDILLAGLRRLEYRGYDSAGIVTIGKEGTTLIREKGKVAELDKKVSQKVTTDMIGIGHTRWATHGEPSERNAHPHIVGDIALVHNGIIENYLDLRAVLQERGYEFSSETDSEVLAALIDSIYQTQADKKLHVAVADALKMVVGAYGIAVMALNNSKEIVVARKGSPLVLGVADGEVFVASDPSALIGHTDQVIYLRDDEIATCTVDGVNLTDSNVTKVDPVVEKLELDIQAIQKKGYKHFLLKRYLNNLRHFDQPSTVVSSRSKISSVSEVSI
jgi:glutamine---fructose-6-phosphate transaminase (isomerizing)